MRGLGARGLIPAPPLTHPSWPQSLHLQPEGLGLAPWFLPVWPLWSLGFCTRTGGCLRAEPETAPRPGALLPQQEQLCPSWAGMCTPDSTPLKKRLLYHFRKLFLQRLSALPTLTSMLPLEIRGHMCSFWLSYIILCNLLSFFTKGWDSVLLTTRSPSGSL